MLRINYNTLLFYLLCTYAFLIPFEHILEIFYGIDTVLKPYRVLAILIIFTYIIRGMTTGVSTFSKDIKSDIFFYSIFIYGLIITMVQAFLSPFELRHFYNDAFQITLYLSVFFIFKNTNFTLDQITKITWSLVAGILINAVYLFNNFYFLKDFRRQSGFMDNPNYVSISLVIAISFILLQLTNIRKILFKTFFSISILFLLLVLVISGSRTGFLIFGMISLIIFFYASWGKKLLILGGMAFLFLMYSGKTGSLGAPLIVFERLDKIDSSEDTRFPLWRGAFKAVLSSNFAGLGIGQFKTRFREFYLYSNEKTIYENVNRGAHLSPHSDYVAIGVTYGILGIFCYLLFLFHSYKTILKNLLSAENRKLFLHFQFCLILLITLTIFGITSENFTSAIYWMSLAISTKMIT